MTEFWNERYAAKEFAYGLNPNSFFQENLEALTPGNLLLPAEGEGRNAVFAALQGWDVMAFDYSKAGQQKALALANSKKTSINYSVSDVKDFYFKKNAFDAVAMIYSHLPPHLRSYLHLQVIDSLLPGGVLILEMFSKNQLNYQSGGPKSETGLYSIELIEKDFSELTTLKLSEEIISLDEGIYHRGEGSVIRYIGKKKEV